ncbi:hypothetical protein [Streptomyces sp. NPDC053079]|uniref:hypothetical protein n=1 Tax=Streptomyces sp. NPDC053079 TaxID=3365697 RepID=UPI0037D4A57B
MPSAVAVAVAAAGLVWLGRLLGGPRLGLCAGLLLAVLPTASRYAQEARSFAFVMAVAVLATGALVKALSSSARSRWLVCYAVLMALLGWFNVMGLLLVAAHAVTVALRRPGRRVVVRLLLAQAAGIAAVVPLLLMAVSLGHPLFAYRYLLFCLPACRPWPCCSRRPPLVIPCAGSCCSCSWRPCPSPRPTSPSARRTAARGTPAP